MDCTGRHVGLLEIPLSKGNPGQKVGLPPGTTVMAVFIHDDATLMCIEHPSLPACNGNKVSWVNVENEVFRPVKLEPDQEPKGEEPATPVRPRKPRRGQRPTRSELSLREFLESEGA